MISLNNIYFFKHIAGKELIIFSVLLYFKNINLKLLLLTKVIARLFKDLGLYTYQKVVERTKTISYFSPDKKKQ